MQAALSSWLGDVIEVQCARGRRARTRRCGSTVRLRRAADRRDASRRPFEDGVRRDDAGSYCRDDAAAQPASRERDLNGLDYVEVERRPAALLHGLLPAQGPPSVGAASNVRIDGGRRIRDIRGRRGRMRRRTTPTRDDCLDVTARPARRLLDLHAAPRRVDAGRAGDAPLHGFDPRYAALDFTFKVDCPTRSRLRRRSTPCPPPSRSRAAELDYLAKDYASFRQLMLDRLALIMPDWRERHVRRPRHRRSSSCSPTSATT